MALAGGVVALLLIGTFALMFLAITRLCDAGMVERRSAGVLMASERLEKSVIDLDEESRGLVLTGDPSFLRGYSTDRAAVPAEETSLVRPVRDGRAGPAGAADRPGRRRVRP